MTFIVWTTWERKLIKQRRYSMKDDVIGLPHKFEALYSTGITNENHHLSPRGEFILSNVFWDKDVGSTSKHSQMRDVRLVQVQCLEGRSPR